MHLQSLELLGFKSFADKTTFNFHEGVTAIVGPNGCGKSNVLDAVRWVLGEQSAKALRGGEMADVIFNGTDNRKPVGFAEVSLTFSDCAGELGVDWHDVRVTRRVYRDGNSEYLLNKTVCRLKDIQSLFADTGVGRSAYSIMEQGKLDLLLSSRPEDRRSVFEEAAGITKYKTQKKEALRKLEATEANLLRIGDIIKEVKRQIGSLQRQAGKARRYQALMADLQVLDTHHSRQQLDAFERELEQSREELAALAESERTAHAQIDASENELAAKRHELDTIDARIADARAELQSLDSELAANRSRIEFNRQRAQEFAEWIERHERDIAAAEAKRSEQESQIHEADALIETTTRLLESKQSEAEQLAERLRDLRGERQQAETQLQALQMNLSRAETRIVALDDELAGLTARREATATRVAEIAHTISEAEVAAQECRSRFTRAQLSLRQQQTAAQELLASLASAEDRLRTEQQNFAAAEKQLHGFERQLLEKHSRLDVLRQLAHEGEGLEKGSQAVLKGLDDPERFRAAIGGALVAALNVDREFIPALEAAFGRNMHAVVLQNAGVAAEIVEKLTAGKLGQAALAIPSLLPPEVIAASEMPAGAIGWAIDKVEVPAELQPTVTRLLHNVAIVTDVATALRLKREAPQLAFATISGEFISAEGILFGGTSSAESESLLSRRAVISELAEECERMEAEQRALASSFEDANARVATANERALEARALHQTAHQQQSHAAVELIGLERAVQDAEQKLAQLNAERGTLDQQIANADERIATLRSEIVAQRTAVTEQQVEATTLEERRSRAVADEEEAAEQLSDLRLALATERQRHENLLSQRQPMAARRAELVELVAARRTDIAQYQNRLAAQANESAEAEAKIEEQSAERTAADARLAGLANGRAARSAAVTQHESALRTLRSSLDALRDSRSTHEVRQTQLEMRIDNLLEHISRRYRVDLRTFEADTFAFQKTLSVLVKRKSKPGDDAAVEAESVPETTAEASVEEFIAELTRHIDNMGPVNLDAVQEYDELEERHRFLDTQNNDLTAARKELLDVIARINATTQKLFADTFAQVRINFREMFAELFGGGRADLSLVDENDPLNCGIEIIAKPPGKQLQSVSLLSGGERAMTAVALLFAIYMVRPSPFCILDEMDAPLDESNINRFIKLLERFVQQSQFILMTHNKRTIARADVLYGVTMEERGVSKLVGMKLSAEKGSDGKLRAPRRETAQAQFPPEAAEQERELALGR